MIGGVLLAAAFSLVPSAEQPEVEDDPCATLISKEGSPGAALRSMAIEDLAEIADIGQPMSAPAPSAFGLAPDEGQLAVIVRRANTRTNSYCQRLLVTSLQGNLPPIEVDRGGGFIHDDFSLRDFTSIAAGWTKTNPPIWSPDGTRLGYLRRDEGSTQLWLADPSGQTAPFQATKLPDDIDDFAWLPDGKGVIVSTRPEIRRAAEAIAREGLSGYLFDGRFAPQFADHPIPTGETETKYLRVSLPGGETRPASANERLLLAQLAPEASPSGAYSLHRDISGSSAWLERKIPGQLVSPSRLVLELASGARKTCSSADCEQIIDLWWVPEQDALLFLANTGWANGQMALLRWDIADPAPHRIMLTDGMLIGCSLARSELVCSSEGATAPRRLVAIDILTGAERVILDPNPQLSNIRFGPVERFLIRNSYGVESFADLVLPPDHRAGQRHPLVVVQYESRGFLRGGTGDEVPIHPLAARGFAVLSFHRPGLLPQAYAARNEIETHTLLDDPWADRRQILSSLEQSVDRAVATGAVDPARIGITGFSDGGATLQFALINSSLFRVASLGTCCEDMNAFALAAGPALTDYLRAMGYRYFERGMTEYWRPMSMLLNADKIKVPILVQASDSEYEGALDVVEAFRHRGKPFELFVFPNETHYKWQPSHRAAIYRRNIDWFEFWLKGRMDCDPALAGQYERWLAMAGAPRREALACMSGPSGHP